MSAPRTIRRWLSSPRIWALVVALLVLRFVPAWWCRRAADTWSGRERAAADALATRVARWAARPLRAKAFGTGSRRFDDEWVFGAYMMAAMGAGQLARAHSDHAARHLAEMRRAIAQATSAAARRFDREGWRGADPLETLGGEHSGRREVFAGDRSGRREVFAGDRGHAAYLGYLNLALSLERSLDPATPNAKLNDRITRTLASRLARAELALVETYPGELYPVDNCAVAASIALHARATANKQHLPAFARFVRVLEKRYVAPNGLLYQRVAAGSGAPVDAPRGSGSALAAYFLSFADQQLSTRRYRAVREALVGSLLGFGMVREYARERVGRADIDSGPVVLGYGVSATGFAIGAARAHADTRTFRSLYATLHLFGAPHAAAAGELELLSGGPLGNAIALAMLSAGATR
ncbi:MAG: hypothetical protein KC503_06045 [Myxococcales bacterium]|nr:hypothetical protein [Myxococcales bacterium]